jgi:hypothetical protein
MAGDNSHLPEPPYSASVLAGELARWRRSKRSAYRLRGHQEARMHDRTERDRRSLRGSFAELIFEDHPVN